MNRSRQGLSFELLRSKIHRVDAEKYCAKDNLTLFDKKKQDFHTLSERALTVPRSALIPDLKKNLAT